MMCWIRILLCFGATRGVCVVLFFVFFSSKLSVAFELFGVHLFGKKELRPSSYHVDDTKRSYTVEIVVPQGAPSEGLKIAKAASSLIADQDQIISSSSSLLAKARSDYRAILFALYSDGRYGSTISIKINGLEAAELSPVTQLPVRSAIVITVDAGPQYIFGDVHIDQATSFAKYKTRKTLSVEDLGYKIGAIARSDIVLKAEQWAIAGWRRQGYAKAEISSYDIVVDHVARTVRARISIDPKQKVYYGPLDVRNISKHPRVDSDYIAWMTGLKVGQQYNAEDLDNANKRVTRLDIFHAVDIHEADTVSGNGYLPLSLIVEERKARRFGIGGNYSVLDGMGFEAYWMHRNLFGRAERLKIEAKINGASNHHQEKSNYLENFDYLLGAEFIKPGIITPDTAFEAQLKIQRDGLGDYITTAIKGKVGIIHAVSDDLSGQAAVLVYSGHTLDNYHGDRHFATIGLQSGIVYDSRNNKFNAIKGAYSEVTINPFYETKFNHFMTKIVAEGRSYWAFDKKNRFIFATRAKFGTIIGRDVALLPQDMLFFSGGGGSVRGYAYRNIGIKTEDGSVAGGYVLAEGSAELRFSLGEKIGFVNFIDGGYVGERIHFGLSQKIKWGAGFGGRYMTNFGPLRFDIAWPLQRENGDPKMGFYVGIGQAF
ncbi:autotransporter assembly complex protein TamA [Bartonella ancashensis]|uniref:Bacterial surface antigen (D15) domain-containing protein n=1 Tax=Bartonella ancashensis TaxID=1318743 RepID=A0A0M4LI42_9HYPH|nr:autotransporter assembly complex family protein [Bartonella ancashensis]ALE03306.1 hypothetical protein PU02_0492 [Bartonella ancashensis]